MPTAPLVTAALDNAKPTPFSPSSLPVSPPLFEPSSAFSNICRPLENTTGNVNNKSTHNKIFNADKYGPLSKFYSIKSCVYSP